PERKRDTASLDAAVKISNYTTEARVTADSAVLDKTVGDLHKLSSGKAMVIRILGANGNRRTPLPDATLKLGDIVVLEGEPEALDNLVWKGGLTLSDRVDSGKADEIGVV